MMRYITAPSVLLLAVAIGCSSDKTTGPDVRSAEPDAPEAQVAKITGVVVSASEYSTVVGATARLTATVSTQGTVGYTVQWSVPDSNAAVIDATTGVLTAKAPGYAFPKACATSTGPGKPAPVVCAETTIRILAKATTAENLRLAFVRNGSIFSSASDGSAPKVIVPDATRPSWSPDGTRIAFVRPAGNIFAKWQLCIANEDGSEVRCATGSTDGRIASKPSWSPDGSKLVFTVFTQSPCNFCTNDSSKFTLMILNTATMHVETLTTAQVATAAWSPSGSKIALVMARVGTYGRGALATVNADGSGLQVLALSLGDYSVDDIAWSPDGAKLAVVLSDENACPWYCDTAIGIVDAYGAHLKVLDKVHTCMGSECQGREAYIWGAPEWLGDGDRLSYTVTSDGRCYDELVNCGTDIRSARIDDGQIQVLLPSAGFPSHRK